MNLLALGLDSVCGTTVIAGAWSGSSVRMNIKLASSRSSRLGWMSNSRSLNCRLGRGAFYNLIADRQNLIIAENSLKNVRRICEL